MSRLSDLLNVFAPVQSYSGTKKPKSIKLNFRNISEIDNLPPKQLETYKDIEELSLNHNKL